MFNSRSDIYYASRTELIDYLENWGFAVYDTEDTDNLRDAAIDCFDAEADGLL
tara:strand:+ start:299 stop:457 length:159 start_codon:yes stop_codon:yes gene_type:complete